MAGASSSSFRCSRSFITAGVVATTFVKEAASNIVSSGHRFARRLQRPIAEALW
jgi:hypothetical protein